MTDDVKTRVARGAALLDSEDPAWFIKVDVSTLNQGLSARCVLGQLYGNFMKGKAALGLRGSTADYAFDTKSGGDILSVVPGYAAETVEWKRVIMERREQGAANLATGSRSDAVTPNVTITDDNIAKAKSVIHEFTSLSPTYAGDLTDTGVLYAVLDALGVLPLVKA